METTRFKMIRGIGFALVCLMLSVCSINLSAASLEQIPLPSSINSSEFVDRDGVSREVSSFNVSRDCGAFEHAGYSVALTIDSNVQTGQLHIIMTRPNADSKIGYDMELALSSDEFYELKDSQIKDPTGLFSFAPNSTVATYTCYGYPKWESNPRVSLQLPTGVFFEDKTQVKSFEVSLPTEVTLTLGVEKANVVEGEVNNFWVKSNLPLSPKASNPTTPFSVSGTLSQAVNGKTNLSVNMLPKTIDKIYFEDLSAPRLLGRQFNDGGTSIALNSVKVPSNAIVSSMLPGYVLADIKELSRVSVKTSTPVVTPGQDVEFYLELDGVVSENNGTEPLYVQLKYASTDFIGPYGISIAQGKKRSDPFVMTVIGTNRAPSSIGVQINDPYTGLLSGNDCVVDIEPKTNLHLELDWGTRWLTQKSFSQPEYPQLTLRVLDINTQDMPYSLDTDVVVSVSVSGTIHKITIPKGASSAVFTDATLNITLNPSIFTYAITDVTGGNSVKHATPKYDPNQTITCNYYLPTRIFYVNPAATGANTGLSWKDAFKTISTAVAEAKSGQQAHVYVAGGTYHETPRVGPGITLEGGYAPNTMNRTQTTVVTGGMMIDSIDPLFPVFVDGFTFEKTIDAKTIYVQRNATLSNAIIKNNVTASSLLVLQNSAIARNITVYENVTTSPTLPLISIDSGLLENSKIIGNRSSSFCGAIFVDKGELVNNLVANNQVALGYGGGIYVKTKARLVANTVVRNKASVAGGIYLGNTLSELIDNAIWGNSASEPSTAQISVDLGPVFKNNAIQGVQIDNNLMLGSDNVLQYNSPSFKKISEVAGYVVNATDYDWKVSYSSTMVAAGSDNDLDLPYYDINGVARITPSTVGAYELTEKTGLVLTTRLAGSELGIKISAKDKPMNEDIVINLDYNRNDSSFVFPPKTITLPARNKYAEILVPYSIFYNGDRLVRISGALSKNYKQIDKAQCELISEIRLNAQPVVVKLHTVSLIGNPDKTEFSEGEKFELYATVDENVTFSEPINIWVDFGANGSHFYSNNAPIVDNKVNLRMEVGTHSTKITTPTVLQVRNVSSPKSITMKVLGNEFIETNPVMDKTLSLTPRIFYVAVATDRKAYTANSNGIKLMAVLDNDAVNTTGEPIELTLTRSGAQGGNEYLVQIAPNQNKTEVSIPVTSLSEGIHSLSYQVGSLRVAKGFNAAISTASVNFGVVKKPTLVLVPPAVVTEGDDLEVEVKLVSDLETMTPYVNDFGEFYINLYSETPHLKDKNTQLLFPNAVSSIKHKFATVKKYLGYQPNLMFDLRASATNITDEINSSSTINATIVNTTKPLAKIELSAETTRVTPGVKSQLFCELKDVQADPFPGQSSLNLSIQSEHPELWTSLPTFVIDSNENKTYKVDIEPVFYFRKSGATDNLMFASIDNSLINVGTPKLQMTIDKAPDAPITLTVQDSVIENKQFVLTAQLPDTVKGNNLAITISADAENGGAIQEVRPYNISLNQQGVGSITLTPVEAPENIRRRNVTFELVEGDGYVGANSATIGILPKNTPTLSIALTANNTDSTWKNNYLREAKTSTLVVSLDKMIQEPVTVFVKIDDLSLFEPIIDTSITILPNTKEGALTITAIANQGMQGLRTTLASVEYFEESTAIPLILPASYKTGIVDDPLPELIIESVKGDNVILKEIEAFPLNASISQQNNGTDSLVISLSVADSSVYTISSSSNFTFLKNTASASTQMQMKNDSITYQGPRDATVSADISNIPFASVKPFRAKVYDVNVSAVVELPAKTIASLPLPMVVKLVSTDLHKPVLNKSKQDVVLTFTREQGGQIFNFTAKIAPNTDSVICNIPLVALPLGAPESNITITCTAINDNIGIIKPAVARAVALPAGRMVSLQTNKSEIRVGGSATLTATLDIPNNESTPVSLEVVPADPTAWDQTSYIIWIPGKTNGVAHSQGSVNVKSTKIPAISMDSTFKVKAVANAVTPDPVLGQLNIAVKESVNCVGFASKTDKVMITQTTPKEVQLTVKLTREGSVSKSLTIPVVIAQNSSGLQARLVNSNVTFVEGATETTSVLVVQNDKVATSTRQLVLGIVNNGSEHFIIGDNPVMTVDVVMDIDPLLLPNVGFTNIAQTIPASMKASMMITSLTAETAQLSISGKGLKPMVNFDLYYANGKKVPLVNNRYNIEFVVSDEKNMNVAEVYLLLGENAIQESKDQLKVSVKIAKAWDYYGVKVDLRPQLGSHTITFNNDKPHAIADLFVLTQLKDTEKQIEFDVLKNDIPYAVNTNQLIVEGFSKTEAGPFTSTLEFAKTSVSRSDDSYNILYDYEQVVDEDIEQGFQDVFFYKLVQVGASSAVARVEINAGRPYANGSNLSLTTRVYTRAPSVFGEYYDLIKDPELKKLRKLTFKVAKTSYPSTDLSVVFNKFPPIYNASKINQGYKSGLWLIDMLNNVQLDVQKEAVGMPVNVVLRGTPGETRYVEKNILSQPPIVLSYADTVIIDASGYCIIKVAGSSFSAKPKAYALYKSVGKNSLSKMTLSVVTSYKDPITKQRIDLPVGDPTNASFVYLKLPKKAPKNALPRFDLIIDNGVGLGTFAKFPFYKLNQNFPVTNP